MIQLNPDESRVLGVLIEKATTTPDQYPLSLNATVNGCNQKNNRDPVLTMTEDAVLDALTSLRDKGLVVQVDTPGSRVHKYRHNAGDALHARTAELAILAELLLRGPQTLGELRGRASRMSPLESLEVVKGMLTALAQREEPLIRELPPSPGSRAERYMQLICPELHPVEAAAPTSPASISSSTPGFADRIAMLETEVAQLKDRLRRLEEVLGEPTPSPGTPGDGRSEGDS
jgi:uncharacterized protein YceH (UPF0502 family)